MIFISSKPVKEKNVMQTLYLSQDQTRELVTTIGANAVLVFTHYIALAHQALPNMEDSHLAKLTGLSEQVVKRTRLELTKLGWFLRIKDTYKGETKITYLVGKEAVSAVSRAVLKVKQPKATQELKDKLVKHFECTSWEEVTASKSQDDISAAAWDLL
jgi:hypothetical protein